MMDVNTWGKWVRRICLLGVALFLAGCKLPPVANFRAEALRTEPGVRLSWEPLVGYRKLGGYMIYRRLAGEGMPEPLFARPLFPGASSYVDRSVAHGLAYEYTVVPLTRKRKPGMPAEPVRVFAAWNDVAVSGVTALFREGVARISWEDAGGLAVEVGRTPEEGETTLLARLEEGNLCTDAVEGLFGRISWQVRTFKEATDPQTGERLALPGPWSAGVELLHLPLEKPVLEGCTSSDSGDWAPDAGTVFPVFFSASLPDSGGPFALRAVSGEDVWTETAAAADFRLPLPRFGQWRVSAVDASEKTLISSAFILFEDGMPPTLRVDGPESLESPASSHVFTGKAEDNVQVRRFTVYGESAGVHFTPLPGEDPGAFSVEVPLVSGENLFTFKAVDAAGNESLLTRRVLRPLSSQPRIALLRPSPGETVFSEKIVLEGRVETFLPAGDFSLEVQGAGGATRLSLRQGEKGIWLFSSEPLPLALGSNYFDLVMKQGADEAVRLRVAVVRKPPAAGEAPHIFLENPPAGAFVPGLRMQVAGSVQSADGVDWVRVNGLDAAFSGEGTTYAFQHVLDLGGEGEHGIRVEARSGAGFSASLEREVVVDTRPPEILFASGLLSYPEINPVRENPWRLAGFLRETHPAGLHLGDESLALNPAGPGEWAFATGLSLPASETVTFRVMALDRAGNRSERLVRVRYEGDAGGRTSEILYPQTGARFYAAGAAFHLQAGFVVRGLESGDTVALYLNDARIPDLSWTGERGSAFLSLPPEPAAYRLKLVILDAQGGVLGGTESTFEVLAAADLPLEVRMRPEEDEGDVAPDAFVALYFNRPIDPAALEVVLEETAHTLSYAATAPGRDMQDLSAIPMETVHREMAPVPGGLSWFPEKTLAAFYPERDFAWGATVHVTVRYAGEELVRRIFTVRPLPTFLQGFVTDTRMTPLAGVKVRLVEPDLHVMTDSEGSFGFGFGDRVEDRLAPGLYRLEVNPGMERPDLGSLERRVHAATGEMNRAGMFRVPVIRGDLPVTVLGSGMADVSLDGGELVLDLKDAFVFFRDGRDKKPVTAVFLDHAEIPWPMDSVMPGWVYMLLPGPIEVAGEVGLSFQMPALYGSHDYVEAVGDRVVLVGLDPDTGSLRPVGVGLVDRQTRQVRSERLELRRLDALGYAFVAAEAQETLKACGEGAIRLCDLPGRLGSGEAAGAE